jgi:N-acetylmuramoyl-L-alanine amidase
VSLRDACAKLIKKRELRMSMEIKNGKLINNNIYNISFCLIATFSVLLTTYASGVNNNKKWTIVIDAGHGGKDPGAIGTFSKEEDITLAIALRTGEYLEKNISNVNVIYTRKTDSTVNLNDRAEIANKANADLFISIHANWAKSKSVQGTETYIMGLAKDQQNLEVAMKENEAILLENDHSTRYEGFDPKSPESYIMFSLMQNIYQEQSTNLASKMQLQFKDRVNRNDRGVKQAGFWVLFMTTMPSVLTETGFITNPAEEKFLNSKEGQDFIASAILRACKEYITEINNKSGISAASDTTREEHIKTIDEEVIFAVQVATSKNKTQIKPENFKGLNDIEEIRDKERYKYFSGRFSDYTEAIEYRKKIKSLFPDAFVIAVKDNKILPLQQALDLKNKKQNTQ